MFIKALATLSVAAVIAVSGASVFATTAEAHQRKETQARTVHPHDVWVGNEFAGRDADPNVRYEILRSFGSVGG